MIIQNKPSFALGALLHEIIFLFHPADSPDDKNKEKHKIDVRIIEINDCLLSKSPQERMSLHSCNKKLKELFNHYCLFKDLVQLSVKDIKLKDSKSFCYLGYCYMHGFGVERDESQAKIYFQNSTTCAEIDKKFVGEAYYNLGNYYLEKGQKERKKTVKDKLLHEAFLNFYYSVSHTHADAEFKLGCCYLNGTGVDANTDTAVMYFKQSASKNNADAQNLLGLCYQHGKGCKIDLNQAFIFFKRAAKQNHPFAQYNVSICYKLGNGVTQNDYKASKYEKAYIDQNFIPPDTTITNFAVACIKSFTNLFFDKS